MSGATDPTPSPDAGRGGSKASGAGGKDDEIQGSENLKMKVELRLY